MSTHSIIMMAITNTKYNSGLIPSIGCPGGNVLVGSDKRWYNKSNINSIRIGTWNVRTMAAPGKIENTIEELKRLKIQIMGISEMRWCGAGQRHVDEYTIYYSGTTNDTAEYGVGIILEKRIAHCVTNFVPVSERILLIQINARPVNINIIQIYAYTTECKDEDLIEKFYEQITDLTKTIPKHEMLLIMGDFNAKIGKGRIGEHIGNFGLGERNDRGERLSMFAVEQDLIVTNTFFQHHPRRLYTWKSNDKVTRNQIDFLLINRRFRNSITDIKTYPGADVQSDHNPLVASLQTIFKKVKKKTVKRFDYRKLKRGTIKDTVKRKLQEISREGSENIEEELKQFKIRIEKIKEEYLKPEIQAKKSWMTEEIINLMNNRRTFKNKTTEYRRIQGIIRTKIREAKEKEHTEKCEEIERCQERGDMFNLHKKVKEVTGTMRKKSSNILTDPGGKIITDKGEVKKVWELYIKELFHDERPDPPHIRGNTGPQILEEEVEAAIKNAKENKAVGPDEIPAELVKLFGGENIKWITTLYNKIYNSGTIPREWLKSEFIILPKKAGAKKCGDFRTISIMSHLLKIFLKIIHSRIYKKCEEQVSDSQFGFRSAVGTREALFAINVLFQRCRDVNCDVFVCFIDYQKAFDRVQHGKMMEVMQKTGLDAKDLNIIINLYWNQSANIRLEGECTEDIEILRGVRQGCVLSPTIFNLYSEYIFKEALENSEEGILLNGERISNIRYADDTVLMANTPQQLQNLIDRVARASATYNMKLNTSKTKIMIVKKRPGICRYVFNVEGEPLEQVSSYKYLGTYVNQDWGHKHEIKIRIEMARTSFNRMRPVLCNMHLNLNTRIRVLKCYVFSVLLYGVEVWTLTKETLNRLESFEMWCYRRMLRISWIYHVTNETVLERMTKTTEIITTVKRRKLAYFGHIIRNNKYKILQDIVKCNLSGTRARGRPRTSWFDNITNWTTLAPEEVFIRALDKECWATIVANV
uniref:Craniofacial development protein 2 n=1 Tax=Cacopsylla melanoneura TaxID=428564 RepID=A0A8D8VC16_9HEMI